MPDLRCPACGRGQYVPREQLGCVVRCRYCRAERRAEAPPWDVLSAGHPAGLWVGRLLLALAAVGLGWAAWAATSGGQQALREPSAMASAYGGATAGLAGALLVWRWRRAAFRRELRRP